MKDYLTASQLAARLGKSVKTIHNLKSAGKLIEGRHYFRPFGGHPLFDWDVIEADMRKGTTPPPVSPMPAATAALYPLQRRRLEKAGGRDRDR